MTSSFVSCHFRPHRVFGLGTSPVLMQQSRICFHCFSLTSVSFWIFLGDMLSAFMCITVAVRTSGTATPRGMMVRVKEIHMSLLLPPGLATLLNHLHSSHCHKNLHAGPLDAYEQHITYLAMVFLIIVAYRPEC